MLSNTDKQTKEEKNLLDSSTCGIEMTPQRLERDLDYKAGFRLITPHLRGGDGMASADQSAKDSEPESSREKKLPSVGDRQKTTKISRSGDPETSLRGHEADKKR